MNPCTRKSEMKFIEGRLLEPGMEILDESEENKWAPIRDVGEGRVWIDDKQGGGWWEIGIWVRISNGRYVDSYSFAKDEVVAVKDVN